MYTDNMVSLGEKEKQPERAFGAEYDLKIKAQRIELMADSKKSRNMNIEVNGIKIKQVDGFNYLGA